MGALTKAAPASCLLSVVSAQPTRGCMSLSDDFDQLNGGKSMQAVNPAGPASKKQLWTGRIITGIVALFLLFDAVTKIIRESNVLQAFARLGYPAGSAVAIGTVLLTCLVIYLIPRTAVLGAILLTGYLGGATDANFRAGNPLFETLFPVIFGALVWAGVFLRERRLRDFVPLRHSSLS
jgi:DoxX-like family